MKGNGGSTHGDAMGSGPGHPRWPYGNPNVGYDDRFGQ
jgi:hypothetical protein